MTKTKQTTFYDFPETKEIANYFDKQKQMHIKTDVHKYKSVKEKLQHLELGPKPYFLPVLAGSTPYWKHPSILVAWSRIPLVRQKLPYDYNKTLIIVESGGYLEEKPSTEEECLSKQMRIYPDLCFTLDFPVKVIARQKEKLEVRRSLYTLPESEKRKRVEMTIQNAKLAMEIKEKVQEIWNHVFEPMAVLHGYDKASLIHCTEELYSMGYEFFAMGTVPTDVGARHIPHIVSELELVRDIVGNKCFIHLLGITEVKVLKRVSLSSNQTTLFGDDDEVSLLKQAKNLIDSFDSATLTHMAVYAKLFTPDGKTIDTKTNPNYKHLYPTNRFEYQRLQELNFQNFIKYLKKELWKVA